MYKDILNAKPFLKWAGGKSQLIPAIGNALPTGFFDDGEVTYVEPFMGSGAVLFWMLKRFPNIGHAVINDINTDLYNAYQTIKSWPELLIDELSKIQKSYYELSEEGRKLFFLDKRLEFNNRTLSEVNQTAVLIFLNKTCFNGLYRVNSKNHFNVPFGRYTNPKICDAETIMADSALLQRVTILNGDYTQTLNQVTGKAFFYLDPPYRPISKTSSFNAYAHEVFDDSEQKRLKQFCDTLSSQKHYWLLSNSDPKNINPHDDFFEDLYNGDDIYIDRVQAKRFINSNSAKRGAINELLISNYTKSL